MTTKASPRKLDLSLLWKVFGTAFFDVKVEVIVAEKRRSFNDGSSVHCPLQP